MSTETKLIKSKDGIDLYYETTIHDRPAPVIFFVHGVGGDLDAWKPIQQAFFEKGFSTIAMDLRGHGYSGHPTSFKKYTLDCFVQDAMDVLNAEHVEKIILVGHSLGAVLVTHIVLQRPERIEKLVLISSSYIPPPYFKIPGMLFLFNALAFISPPALKKTHSLYPAGKFHHDVEVWGLLRTIARNSLRSYLLSSKEILKTNIKSELKKISCPTLLLTGDADSIFPTQTSHEIADEIPNAQLKIIPGGNHVIILNNTQETIDALSDFLK